MKKSLFIVAAISMLVTMQAQAANLFMTCKYIGVRNIYAKTVTATLPNNNKPIIVLVTNYLNQVQASQLRPVGIADPTVPGFVRYPLSSATPVLSSISILLPVALGHVPGMVFTAFADEAYAAGGGYRFQMSCIAK